MTCCWLWFSSTMIMRCGCRRIPGAGELAGTCGDGCVAATDPGAADAPLAGGREDWHPALMAATVNQTATTGIRIPERYFTNTPQSWHAAPVPRNAGFRGCAA